VCVCLTHDSLKEGSIIFLTELSSLVKINVSCLDSISLYAYFNTTLKVITSNCFNMARVCLQNVLIYLEMIDYKCAVASV